MKNCESLDLAEKAGLIKSNWSPIDGAFASTHFDIQDELYAFVRLVEQATLERAAKHFTDHNYGEFYRDEVAAEIRALKGE